MKPKELLKAIWFQMRKKNAFKNIVITHNAFGILSINSHIAQYSGKEKVSYPTLKSATKAANQMEKKHNKHFSVYKCAYCTGYHVGKNKENKYEI